MLYALDTLPRRHRGETAERLAPGSPIILGLPAWIARDLDNIPRVLPHLQRRGREDRLPGSVADWRVLREFDVSPDEAREICESFADLRFPGERVRYRRDDRLMSFILTDPRGRPWSGTDGKAIGVEPARPRKVDLGSGVAGVPSALVTVGLGERLRRRRGLIADESTRESESK